MEAKLKDQLEAKLKEQSEQLEYKLNEHSGKQSEQFQEAVRQISECQKVYKIWSCGARNIVIVYTQVMGVFSYRLILQH